MSRVVCSSGYWSPCSSSKLTDCTMGRSWRREDILRSSFLVSSILLVLLTSGSSSIKLWSLPNRGHWRLMRSPVSIVINPIYGWRLNSVSRVASAASLFLNNVTYIEYLVDGNGCPWRSIDHVRIHSLQQLFCIVKDPG